jgi:hypothetical protein
VPKLVLAFALAPCVFSLLLLLEINYTDCVFLRCPPARIFRVLELDLPRHLFPDQSIVNGFSESSDVTGGIEDAGLGVFFANGESLSYQMLRFVGQDKAVMRFDAAAESFREDYTKTEEMNFDSPAAQNTFLACGVFMGNSPTCRFVATYDEYYVFLGSDMNDQMTYDSFLEIVRFIDQQMEDRLAE